MLDYTEKYSNKSRTVYTFLIDSGYVNLNEKGNISYDDNFRYSRGV